MKRIAATAGTVPTGRRLVVVVAVLFAIGCRHPGVPHVASETRTLGAGVTLAIDAGPSPSPLSRPGLITIWLSVTNHGSDAIQIRYRDFALSDDASVTDGALLPSELGPGPSAARLLREGTLQSGDVASGFLYFRLPVRRPSNLRVDLEATNDRTISRNFLKLRFD